MKKDTATAILREQHRLILRVASAFERSMTSGATLPPHSDIEAFLTFFRLFTDACHHGKEEDLLFVALEEQGMGGMDGPIDAMREEHRAGRAMVRGMVDAASRVRTGAADAGASLRRDAPRYIEFIRGHIAREDDGLFEVADHRIEGPTCAALCDAYETVCLRRFEGLTVAQLERMAEDLITAYPAR